MLVFISVITRDQETAAVAMISLCLQAKKKKSPKQKTEERKMISVSAGGIFCAPGLNFLSGETRSVSRCCCSAHQASFPPGSPSNGGIAAEAALNLLDCASSTGPSPAVPVENPVTDRISGKSGVSPPLPERVGTPARVGDLPQFPFFLSPGSHRSGINC